MPVERCPAGAPQPCNPSDTPHSALVPLYHWLIPRPSPLQSICQWCLRFLPDLPLEVTYTGCPISAPWPLSPCITQLPRVQESLLSNAFPFSHPSVLAPISYPASPLSRSMVFPSLSVPGPENPLVCPMLVCVSVVSCVPCLDLFLACAWFLLALCPDLSVMFSLVCTYLSLWCFIVFSSKFSLTLPWSISLLFSCVVLSCRVCCPYSSLPCSCSLFW